MSNSRDEVLKFLADTQTHYGTYHNHKETSAWAGLALYVLLLTQLVNTAEKTIADSCVATLISMLVVLAAGITFGVFLGMQFSLRRKAASYVAACISLRSKYLSEPHKEIELNRFSPSSSRDSRIEADRCLPEAVLSEASGMEGGLLSFRKILEGCAYGVVILVAILAVARVWLAYAS